MSARVITMPEYVLGSTRREHYRLMRQNRLISNMTRHLLEETPLEPGMRVLDVGSGVGDVALLIAGMVGPAGEVVCVDRDAEVLETARRRALRQGFRNISFRPLEIQAFESGEDFDVVFGRCVLIHQADPVCALVSASKHARPGGVVAFQEPWFSRAFCAPAAPLLETVIHWIHDTVVRATHLDLDLVLRLPNFFLSAGLSLPRLTFEMVVDSQHDPEIFQFIAETAGTLLPRMEQLGIASAETVQLRTLAARLRTEAIALQTMIGIMPLMGAWCVKA